MLGPWNVPFVTVDTVLRGAIRCVVSRPDTCTFTPRITESVVGFVVFSIPAIVVSGIADST